ncbi:hypothetical protein [Caenispirillum salinarum]|uniref:hypothetical protein n=1 Tax=Caenispirillum salinarum TaxID=859058 RepID=UPI0003089029|nr:hypothetical protein [Caenispirillum salinarum]
MKIMRTVLAAGLAIGLAGCLSPQHLGQQLALKTTDALGIGVQADWYESRVGADPTIGHGGVTREAAFEECNELGLAAMREAGTYHGQMGMGHLMQGSTLSTMNSQAKQGKAMRENCMMQRGFVRVRRW